MIWSILVVLFLRFMCSMDCSCMINFIFGEGSSTQDDPCRSNIGGRDPCNPCGVDAYRQCCQTARQGDVRINGNR